MRNAIRCLIAAAAVAVVHPSSRGVGAQARTIVLDNVRIIDGTGAPPVDPGRIVIDGDRITSVGPADAVQPPAGAERVDLSGRTVMPGLIDLHFHIEDDPKLALRQLSNGVTAFRDPGQWNEKFVELRKMIAADGLTGPAYFHDRVLTSTVSVPPIRPIRSSLAMRRKRAGSPSSLCSRERRH